MIHPETRDDERSRHTAGNAGAQDIDSGPRRAAANSSRLGEAAALDRFAARWPPRVLRSLRVLAVALACLLAGSVGALAMPLAPWGGLALPAGIALGAMLRWGTENLLGAALGTALGLLGLLGLALPPAAVIVATVALSAGLLAAVQLLRGVDFDPRLERASDLLWLAAAALGVLSPLAVSIGAAALRFAAPALLGTWRATLVGGWTALVLGTALGALPALSIDRRLWQTPRSPARLAVSLLLGLLAVGLALWLDRAPFAGSTAGPLAWFVVLALLGLLAASGGLAQASIALAAVGIVVARSAHASAPWGGAQTVPAVALAGWLAAACTVVLAVHAVRAQGRNRSQRWEWALDGSRLGVADWHLHRDEAFVSQAWTALTGDSGRRWRPGRWVDQLHVDDRPALATALRRVTIGEAGRLQLEVRLPAAGGFRWHEATLLVIERQPDGRPSRLLATLADVQERHAALARLRLSASLFEHLHEGLLITDGEMRVLDANPAYSEILGVAREELLGTVPSLLRPSPADPIAREQRAAMWAALRTAGNWRGELRERGRDGELRTLQTTISAVPGDGGEAARHVLVIADISEERRQRERLERQAHYDELTRLPNRARLMRVLDEAMRAADREGHLLAVCYLDLDRFKPVNDRFGHAAGDRLLVELAARLANALRRRDGGADTAARLGGDEFVLLLRAGAIDEARLAVERVLRVVSQPYAIDAEREPVQITASMGATVYPIDRSDAETLLRHADHAMYGAKQSGRNGYLFFDPEHRRRAEERVLAIGRVQEALDRDEFVLHYQPKVDMSGGGVLGFEALLRWEHPQHGMISPLQFLPLIEHTGLSARIGDWVIAQALEHLSLWRRDGLDISVSVNVSARHLQESDFALRLAELLARHAEPLAAHLELEVLETAAHADIEATSALLARCRALGVRAALDDFGTGYSTLQALQRLPVDVLKIDRSFVSLMLDDAQARAIVEGVIGLARTFECVVVAEGVESPAQARLLLELGCSIGQGTGVAAPMPARQVADWTRSYRGLFALAPAGPAGAGDASLARLPG